MAAREEELFLEFKRRPDAGTLTDLLRGYQDHIYNISFQVLRHPEDAEDVAQEVLIETARTISRIDSPRQFKVWLYKVALHAALKLKETRARRLELARRIQAPPGGGDMDTEERAALMRAIGDLDDRTRCILIEHYFDKLTLEEIGAREGVSSVAVWKRLGRAKDRLRRVLGGFAVAPALEGLTPVPAPAGLAAKSALIAGGVALGTKTAVTAGGLIAALLILGAAAGGGYGVGAAVAPDRAITAAEPAPSPVQSSSSTPAPRVARVAPAPNKPPEPVTDWNAAAQEAFDLAGHLGTKRFTPNKMQEDEIFGRLNEKTGPWLARKYRESLELAKAAIEKDDPSWNRHMDDVYRAMWLCALSGGSDVSDLLLERLTADDHPKWEFSNLSMMLGGISGWNSWDKIPVTGAHYDAALALAKSDDEFHLRAAIGVLGRFDTPDARRFLTETFQHHPTLSIRQTAAHALGGAGDASTLALLKGMLPDHPYDNRMRKLILTSIARLEARFGSAK